MIYGLSGYFKREKTKKNRLFLVTLPCAKPMAHGELTSLCRVPRALAHDEVCCHLGPQPGLRRVSHSRHKANLSPSPCAQGPRHTAKYLIFAVCHTFSTRRSRPRRRQLWPTPFIIFILPCAMNNTRRMCSPCARYMTHGEHPLRRASGCRRCFAVGHPRRSFRRVLNGLRRVPLAHGEMRKSGSDPSSLP